MIDENETLMVAGVRFSKVGKVYHFSAREVPDLKIGDQVVVETSRGWQLGTVAQLIPAEQYGQDGLKAIDRRATPRDLLLRQTWQAREADVLTAAKTRSEELRLHGVKVVHAEYSFDGTRLAILFSTESEEKYDLKSMRGDMQRMFQPAQVELRQIGPRDVAKMMGGMGACGLETRCCSQFLCEFSSISIRMAKEQGISLTPTEITGMCGRLRCCLIYEYEQYTQARALLPKRNRRVMTPSGEAKVLDQIPMRDAVYVLLMDNTRRVFKRSEIQLIDEDGALIPAMSEEERQALQEETLVEPAEPVEEEKPAAYTLPPQIRQDNGRGGRDNRRNRPQNGGPRRDSPATPPNPQRSTQTFPGQSPSAPERNSYPEDRNRPQQPGGNRDRSGRPVRPNGPGTGGDNRGSSPTMPRGVEGGSQRNRPGNNQRPNRPPQGRPGGGRGAPNRPKGGPNRPPRDRGGQGSGGEGGGQGE